MNLLILVLFGPTASGKTGIISRLFCREGGIQAEIVSADSMQVYRGMDIGTAKPSTAERERIPHHLLDIRNPDEQFNAGDFVRLAGEACREIASRGRLPVVSGGTGFYLKNFILGLSEAPPSSLEIRKHLKQELKEKGAEVLMEELAACDPVSARRIHINDEYRLLRALEVFRTCGCPLSSFSAPPSPPHLGRAPATRCPLPATRFLILSLSCPREELYRRINERCARMIQSGLADEVKALYDKGYTPDDPALRAIGYREFFVKNEDEEKNAAGKNKWRLSQDIKGVQALVAQNSRRYAKRQITFFSGVCRAIQECGANYTVKHIECSNDEDETAKLVKQELEKHL